jgi:hypothetical protein
MKGQLQATHGFHKGPARSLSRSSMWFANHSSTRAKKSSPLGTRPPSLVRFSPGLASGDVLSSLTFKGDACSHMRSDT